MVPYKRRLLDLCLRPILLWTRAAASAALALPGPVAEFVLARVGLGMCRAMHRARLADEASAPVADWRDPCKQLAPVDDNQYWNFTWTEVDSYT